MRKPTFTRSSARRYGNLIAVIGIWLAAQAIALADGGVVPNSTPPRLSPIYWQQPLLFIPYQVNKQDPLAREITEVQLMFSQTGTGQWSVLQSAQPNVQGFSYHAPSDGEYWFALRHLGAKGEPLGGTSVVPQLHLVIDTKLPELNLSAVAEDNGQIAIQYQANDANLQSQSLILEARIDGGLWTNIGVGPPENNTQTSVAGTARWSPSTAAGDIEIRGSIADATGQRGQATATVRGGTPSWQLPTTTPAKQEPIEQPNIAGGRSPFASPNANPFEMANKPSQDWPANNQLAGSGDRNTQSPMPPAANPYSIASDSHDERRTPAKFAVDGAPEPGDSDFAPSLIDANNPSTQVKTFAASTDDSNWSSPESKTGEPLLVNARTFDVEYELAEVGPWGVAKVELWGTADNGKTWQSFGVDPDSRSPARVTVPHGGFFGFRIMVEGANGTSPLPPQANAQPELIVNVDLQPPVVKITAVEPGVGNLAEHLRIRWEAEDDNLEGRPIGLFYSSYPNGPWSAVAAGLENSGSYVWRIERHIPGRFFLRLEARDTAGNVATYQTPQPIGMERPQPTGTLRSVRPVGSVPSVGGN